MCESSNSSDEMASFEVLHNHNGEAVTLDSSEFSLIPEPIQGEGLVNGNFNISNIQSAFMSASQDLSMEDIQERILELVKDNAAMKEALTWNNMMMKQQLSTISAWHNEMTTSMSKQQLSLKDANEKIEELEREKEKLLEEIKELKNHPKQECINEPVIKMGNENEIPEKFVHKLKEAQNIISDFEKKLNEQNAELSNMCSNFEKKESSFKMFRQEHEDLKSRCNTLEEDIEKRNEIIQELKNKVSLLETNIIMEQNALEAECVKHVETKALLNEILPSYERLKKLIQVQSKDQKEKDQNMENEREKECKRYLEEIDRLTAKLLDLEEKYDERNNKVDELTKQISDLQETSENIPVLKGMVEVYESDMNKALQEVHSLTLENQELRSNTYFCNNCGAGTSKTESRSKGRRKSDKSSPQGLGEEPNHSSSEDNNTLTCPVCNRGFKKLETLREHVEQCLS